MSDLPRIYCWVIDGAGTDWQSVLALAEDGTGLAGHVSSSEAFAQMDIGMPDAKHARGPGVSKHELYAAHYPAGYELVWVGYPESRTHEGLSAAYALNPQAAFGDVA